MIAPPAFDAFRASARTIGIGVALIHLAVAVAWAVGLNDLYHGRSTVGTVLILAGLLGRLLVGEITSAWGARTAATLRGRWRAGLAAYLARPRPEGERGRHDLALAIERVATAPGLTLVSTAARVSALGLVVLFLAAGWLATGVVVALLALSAPLYLRAGRRGAELGAEYQARRAVFERRQLELISRAPELRSLGAVDYGAREIAAISESEHSSAMRAIRAALQSSLVTEFLGGVSVGLVAMVVGFGLLNGRISLLRAILAVLVTTEVVAAVRRYGVEFHRREDAEGARRVLEGLTDSRPGIPAPPASSHLLEARALVTPADPVARDLVVGPGDRLRLTGPSGSGKTTLLETLVGWRDPRAGEVIRRAGIVAVVTPESPLLVASLRENLLLDTVGPSDDDLHGLLREIGLDGPRFSDLDRTLLADGEGVSSGERARLALARGVLAGAELLLVDDVAGHLDEASRRRVADFLDGRPGLAVVEATSGPSVLPVAHEIGVGS